jgi:NADH:ubiquinone oxidoreductase subunit K
MSEEQNKKRSPFSIYWIYAAIGLAIMILFFKIYGNISIYRINLLSL